GSCGDELRLNLSWIPVVGTADSREASELVVALRSSSPDVPWHRERRSVFARRCPGSNPAATMAIRGNSEREIMRALDSFSPWILIAAVVLLGCSTTGPEATSGQANAQPASYKPERGGAGSATASPDDRARATEARMNDDQRFTLLVSLIGAV